MKLYLDSVVLIDFLFEPVETSEREQIGQQLFSAIQQSETECIVSFYSLPELFGYVQRNYPPDIVNTVFKESVIVLFSEPVKIVPYLDRTEVNRLRRRFTIADSYDALHIACALSNNCDAIVTYDSHFQTVTDIIPVFTPPQVLEHILDNPN